LTVIVLNIEQNLEGRLESVKQQRQASELETKVSCKTAVIQRVLQR